MVIISLYLTAQSRIHFTPIILNVVLVDHRWSAWKC